MIVFCTTCRGRSQHIKETLPRNLADNQKAKFVLLDYGSPDDLLDYVWQAHRGEVNSGRLAVYSYDSKCFRMAHAKNLAHRLGILEGGTVLVNLDADNFAGKDFDLYVEDIFRRAQHDHAMFAMPRVFLWARMIKGEMKRGVNGRIAMTSNAFLLAGGYDEKYSEWGPDDKDICARLERLGLAPVEVERQFLDAVTHQDKVRFREYPHAQPAEDTTEDEFYKRTSNTIANFGNFGCGRVWKNFVYGERLAVLEPLPTRIFGIGMQKTATNSLCHAFRMLGYDAGHWESGAWAKSILREMREEGRSLTLEKTFMLCDLPIPILFRELDAVYPGSKFILTIRDEADWLQSARDHWSYEHNKFRKDWDRYDAANIIHKATYGRIDFNAEVFLDRYRCHNAEVLDYFKNRPGDLLVMDMSKNAGWEDLCPFIGKPVPRIAYPRSYSAY